LVYEGVGLVEEFAGFLLGVLVVGEFVNHGTVDWVGDFGGFCWNS
jgi:hypothetical protein